MTLLSKQLQEINATLSADCKHPLDAITLHEDYRDNTLGGYGSTAYNLECTIC